MCWVAFIYPLHPISTLSHPALCPRKGKLTCRGCIRGSLVWFCLDSAHGESQQESSQREDDEFSLFPCFCLSVGLPQAACVLWSKSFLLSRLFPDNQRRDQMMKWNPEVEGDWPMGHRRQEGARQLMLWCVVFPCSHWEKSPRPSTCTLQKYVASLRGSWWSSSQHGQVSLPNASHFSLPHFHFFPFCCLGSVESKIRHSTFILA